MMKFGASCPKPTIMWSIRRLLVAGLVSPLEFGSSSEIIYPAWIFINHGASTQDRGKLTKAEKEKKTKVQTTRWFLKLLEV